MTTKLQLFPHIEPFNTGFLNCSEHNIYYEECGNANGKPVVFLHGGPGGGGSEDVRRFFDPAHYRIIVFDQREMNSSKLNFKILILILIFLFRSFLRRFKLI